MAKHEHGKSESRAAQNRRCVIEDCEHPGINSLGVRLRRPDTTAIWAPNTGVFLCDVHARQGLNITLALIANRSGQITTQVGEVARQTDVLDAAWPSENLAIAAAVELEHHGAPLHTSTVARLLTAYYDVSVSERQVARALRSFGPDWVQELRPHVYQSSRHYARSIPKMRAEILLQITSSTATEIAGREENSNPLIGSAI